MNITLQVVSGAFLKFKAEFTDDAGPIDLTGADAIGLVASDYTTPALMEFKPSDGLVLQSDGFSVSKLVELSPGVYVHDWTVSLNGEVLVVLRGELIILEKVKDYDNG